MSHVLNHEVVGWQALPDFPEELPDPSVREVEVRGKQLSVRGGEGKAAVCQRRGLEGERGKQLSVRGEGRAVRGGGCLALVGRMTPAEERTMER